MLYAEFQPPAGLEHAVKLGWTLRADGRADSTVEHVATPDGCVEIIHRVAGRSFWKRPQPPQFAAGLIGEPARLQLSGEAAFVGLRLWPWGLNALSRVRSPDLLDDWIDLAVAAPRLAIGDSIDCAFEAIQRALAGFERDPLHLAIVQSRSVAELARRTGRPRRWLQRWFEREIGLSPRSYLRLLRFGDAIAGLPAATGSLAGHAADHGFADQAHMSREFRSMSGSSAGTARKTLLGPFLDRSRHRSSPS